MIARALRRARWRTPLIQLDEHWFKAPPRADHEPDSWSEARKPEQLIGLCAELAVVLAVFGTAAALLWSL